jgi:toxin-antitoxin system PIN domain toxin
VIVIDANILIYSYAAASAHHIKSSAWVEEALSSGEPVGLSWQTVSAFLRVVTNRRLPGVRVDLREAVDAVQEWLQQPSVRILIPGDGHWPILKRMILEGGSSGSLITEAQLAALTIEYGGVLYTADRDFARFPGLRWENPLA